MGRTIGVYVPRHADIPVESFTEFADDPSNGPVLVELAPHDYLLARDRAIIQSYR